MCVLVGTRSPWREGRVFRGGVKTIESCTEGNCLLRGKNIIEEESRENLIFKLRYRA